MREDIRKFKEEFKDRLMSFGQLKRTNSNWYRLKECPMCGDTKWHCYIKIDSSDDGPVGYNCFKCNSHGMVDQKFIAAIGYLDDLNVPKFVGGRKLNIGETVSSKVSNITVTDVDNVDRVCDYIESRVGVRPTLTDLQFFQYVGNPRKYVTDY